MIDSFSADGYDFTNDENDVSVIFGKSDDDLEEDVPFFLLGGIPFYFEYGDQGNSGTGQDVGKIEFSRKSFHVFFKPETQIVSWEYMASYTPEQNRTAETAIPYLLTELIIGFNFDLSSEDLEGIVSAVAKMTNGVCEFRYLA